MKISWSDSGNLKAITFDATPGDTHLWTATVTEHPVENGAAITDHVRAGAFRLSLEVIVSNTPLTLAAAGEDSFTDGVTRSSAQVSLGQGLGNATVYQWSAWFDRVRKIYDTLTNLIVNPPSDGITVSSTLANYDSMQIVSISVPRSSEMGANAIRFTLEMQQVTIVESQTADTLAPKIAIKHKGHKGKKEEPDKKAASLAHNAMPGAATKIAAFLGGG